MTCNCNNPDKYPPKTLSEAATEEIDKILGDEKLCALIVVGRKGKLLKIYPNHCDLSVINSPDDDNTIPFVLKTKLPRCEMQPEKNFCEKIFLLFRCKYGKLGGECNPCL